jgi:hypothetical protein
MRMRVRIGRPEGIQVEPALLAHVTAALPTRRTRRQKRLQERRVSKRLSADAIDRLVAQYVGGTTAAELGQRYGRWIAAEGHREAAWQEPECRVALSAPVGESVNNARLPFCSG